MALQTFTAGQILTAAQMTTLQTNAYNQTVSNKTASYVLTAADVGTRIVMNNAGATTITVNTSLFAAGDTLFIQNIGAGTCTITAGTATVTTAGSLALAQWGGGTLYFTSASAAIFFSGGGTGYGAATGGSSSSITVSGVNYTLLTFTSTGTLTVTKAGFFDYLLVGAGSGCLYCDGAFPNGGGGGGAIVSGSVYLSANTTITIGAGGSFTTADLTLSSGGDTSIDATSPIKISASGSKTISSLGKPYVFQGSGAGGSRDQSVLSVTSKQGFVGGNSGVGAPRPGGGGGGAGGAGTAGNTAANTGGAGGAGIDISDFIGSSLFKASGGGGASTVTGGAGGSSLGNNGTTTTAGTNAAANTGCGGGGANSAGGVPTAGNGGSGIAYIRFK